MTKRKTIVEVAKDHNEPMRIIADEIRAVAGAVKKIMAGPLKRDAVTMLIQAKSGGSKTQVNNVLWAIENLETLYLKPIAKN